MVPCNKNERPLVEGKIQKFLANDKIHTEIFVTKTLECILGLYLDRVFYRCTLIITFH